jgi:cell division protein FtsB
VSTARVLEHYTQPQRKQNNTTYSPKFLAKQKSQAKQEQIQSIVLTCAIITGMLFVTFQLARGTFINVSRYLTLSTKMTDLQSLSQESNYTNAVLKKNFKSYTSPEGVESLARDYLNLVGDNEIAVILKQS